MGIITLLLSKRKTANEANIRVRAEYSELIHEAACLYNVLAKKKQFNIKTNAHQGVNKNCKNIKTKKILTNLMHTTIITLLYQWHTHNRKGLQTQDTFIWIDANLFLMTKLFQLLPCTICVNTQTSKAMMATAFESVQSIVTTILPAPKFMNHSFSSLIKTVDMHWMGAIRYFLILTLYTAMNDFIHSLPFHL